MQKLRPNDLKKRNRSKNALQKKRKIFLIEYSIKTLIKTQIGLLPLNFLFYLALFYLFSFSISFSILVLLFSCLSLFSLLVVALFILYLFFFLLFTLVIPLFCIFLLLFFTLALFIFCLSLFWLPF